MGNYSVHRLMDKEEAISWADNKLRTDDSDGCTLAPDFGFSICCRRHDVMIRYNQGITDKDADLYLRECITDHGYQKTAFVYWFFARVSNLVGGWQNLVALIVGSALITAIYFWG